MKKISNITLFIFTCLTLSNVATNCFYYGDDPGANVIGTAGTATLIGGAASGNRAAIGAGAGLMGMGAIMGAASRNKDRDPYYRRSRRQQQRDLESENAELRQRLQQYETQQ